MPGLLPGRPWRALRLAFTGRGGGAAARTRGAPNEGAGKAVYLGPGTYLAARVRERQPAILIPPPVPRRCLAFRARGHPTFDPGCVL
jgi:hypothetical protein